MFHEIIIIILIKKSDEAFAIANPRPFFGIDIQHVCERDGGKIPKIVKMCVEFLEKEGKHLEGLYRLSPAHTSLQNLKALADKGFNFLISLMATCGRYFLS